MLRAGLQFIHTLIALEEESMQNSQWTIGYTWGEIQTAVQWNNIIIVIL